MPGFYTRGGFAGSASAGAFRLNRACAGGISFVVSDLPLDLREQLVRIDRAQAELAKFQEETRKFVAEQHKLMAEGDKFRRDRSLAPWLAGGAVAGGILTIANLALRAFGLVP